MALSTLSAYSLVSSLIYAFSFISRFFLSFWKKKFIYSKTRLSSEIILSSLPTSVTLLAIFRFSENNGSIFVQKVLLSPICVGSRLSKYFLRTVLYNLLQKFFCSLYFFIDSEVRFLKQRFSMYDLFMIAFISALVIYGAWFALSILFFIGAYLFNVFKKIFSNEP